MDRVTLQNYRCFREKQFARLAPLTFLVGENSTGKTSFLALLRAIKDVAYSGKIPDFREPPYDLGVFEDIAHRPSKVTNDSVSFEAGFEVRSNSETDNKIAFDVKFVDRAGYPFPGIRRLTSKSTWLEINLKDEADTRFRFGEIQTRNIRFDCPSAQGIPLDNKNSLPSFEFERSNALFKIMDSEFRRGKAYSEDEALGKKRVFLEKMHNRFVGFWDVFSRNPTSLAGQSIYASAPIRSRPRRTYDPSRPTPDPEGEYIPDYIASMSRNAPDQWERLKFDLEDFGRDSGLFDEIAVLSFGDTAGAPFQMQIRKFGKRLKGPKRNLIDVGYGVSQALPILAELLREDSPKMFLLQQPEIHLHPRAQAALGSLFCNLASSGKQIIVETHSDYILDRVRMDIRDRKTPLKAEDVSILYFERGELDVNIHSIRLDKDGNIHDMPLGYRRFFMEETRRSIGL